MLERDNLIARRNIKLLIEYDGTNYHGWQKQANLITIQETLEQALSKVMCHLVSVVGAGRTDAGVHALGQVANFFTTCCIPVEKVPYALNSILPGDIVIKDAQEVSDEFHARYSAKGKKYRYVINNSKFPSALERNREYYYPYKLDLVLMKEALQLFKGTHDFKGFMAGGSLIKNTVRTIYEADLKKEQDRIVIEISGNGFLYNMVRIIVGTLIELGRGKISIEDIRKIITEGNRTKAGPTVPPHGLYLVEVYY